MPQRKLYPNPLQVVFSDEQMDFIAKKADECYYGIKADVVRWAIDRWMQEKEAGTVDVISFGNNDG